VAINSSLCQPYVAGVMDRHESFIALVTTSSQNIAYLEWIPKFSDKIFSRSNVPTGICVADGDFHALLPPSSTIESYLTKKMTGIWLKWSKV